MASDSFAGDPAAMAAAAKGFASALTDLDTIVRPVREGADALPWRGQAADRYQELLYEWLSQFAGICQALENMQTALVGTASSYGESEQWALQSIGALGGGAQSGPTALQRTLGMQ